MTATATKGTLPVLRHAWRVPRCTTQSPRIRCTVEAKALDYSTLYTNVPYNNGPAPWTASHPDPSNGFASSQGVSALEYDGSGLAAHAYAVLVPGAYTTQSIARAIVEFQLTTADYSYVPVDVTLVGDYYKGVFGKVSATLWKGFSGGPFTDFTTLFTLGPSPDPSIGLWDATLTLQTWTTYSLELYASAAAVDGFNLFSRAFIDPVISFDSGPGVEIEFEAAATGFNGAFEPLPALVPLPAGLPLLLTGLITLFGRRLLTLQSRSGRN